MKYIQFILIVIFLSGCAMKPFASGPYIYVPESVNANQPENYATIKTISEHNHGFFAGLDNRVMLTSLDGVSLFEMRWDSDYPEESYLTQGEHEIRILYRYMKSYANGCFTLYAEKGRHYIVKHSIAENAFHYWVEVENIGKIPIGKCRSKS